MNPSIKHYVLPTKARKRGARTPGYVKEPCTRPPTGAVFCRGSDRAARRRLQHATNKALRAKSKHGRAMAARDLQLAKEAM